MSTSVTPLERTLTESHRRYQKEEAARRETGRSRWTIISEAGRWHAFPARLDQLTPTGAGRAIHPSLVGPWLVPGGKFDWLQQWWAEVGGCGWFETTILNPQTFCPAKDFSPFVPPPSLHFSSHLSIHPSSLLHHPPPSQFNHSFLFHPIIVVAIPSSSHTFTDTPPEWCNPRSWASLAWASSVT